MDNIQITHECVKAVNNIGSTVYHNICNGAVHSIPWGTSDWGTFLLLGAILLLAVTTLVGFFAMLIVEWKAN